MNQSKFDPDVSHLTSITNETIGKQNGDHFLSVTMSLPGSLSQQKHYKTCYGTRPKRRFVVYEHDQSAVLFFTLDSWKQEEIFLYIISIFYLYEQTGFVQVRIIFLSLSFRTNARNRQDLYDRKQYHCCPHGVLQSTQNLSSFKVSD